MHIPFLCSKLYCFMLIRLFVKLGNFVQFGEKCCKCRCVLLDMLYLLFCFIQKPYVHFPFFFASFSCMIVDISICFNQLLFLIIIYEIGRYSRLKVEPNGKYIQYRRAKILLPSILQLSHDNKRLFGSIQDVPSSSKSYSLLPTRIFLHRL